MKRILKEPLLHFLLVGLALFAAFELLSSDETTDTVDRIVVDRDQLLMFMQYRAKRFQADGAEDLLDSLPAEELQKLIDDYVREEALYREAKALNLDKNDYASRRRLIQRLEFINQGFISAMIELSEADLVEYMDAHQDRYYVRPKITFTHVFFNLERHGVDGAEALAGAELKELNESQVPFHKGLSHGDRYLYHRNYVNKEADEIASHFGEDMQRQLFALDPDDTKWHGPFRSPYGFHLAMVTKRTAGYAPPLAAVRQRVEQDAIQAGVKEKLDEISQSIVDDYEVEIVGVFDGAIASPEGSS